MSLDIFIGCLRVKKCVDLLESVETGGKNFWREFVWSTDLSKVDGRKTVNYGTFRDFCVPRKEKAENKPRTLGFKFEFAYISCYVQ